MSEQTEPTEPASPAAAAEEAGLVYMTDEVPGYRRVRRGRGFSYLDPTGAPSQDSRLRARFNALVIPPAWTEVWICPDPRGHIQATGRDAKGRKQYIYHPEWDRARNLAKFDRLASFGAALPALRARVAGDLRLPRLTHAKVTAIVVRLLEETLIRIGNPEYARQNDSYGLTTLTDDHVAVEGSRISFTFRGKSGKEHAVDLQDRRLARLVQRCQDLPGQRLFQYLDDNGQCCQSLGSGDVNAYLRAVTGQDFSAKDFRTWGGSVFAVSELCALGPSETEKAGQKAIVQVVKRVAAVLGNTPTVCRKYYIHPRILEAYLDGSLFSAREQADGQEKDGPYGLGAEERTVMALVGN